MKSGSPTTRQDAIKGLEMAIEGLQVAKHYCDVFETDTSSREDHKSAGQPPENVSNLEEANRQLGNHYSQGIEIINLGSLLTTALDCATQAHEVVAQVTYRNE